MVHFHGGVYTSGAAGVQLLNASDLDGLTGGVIVVTCNYRLHAFGFWFAPDNSDESTPGNVALLDQEKCLEWIRDNVAAFGGDPSNVTIWGQSADASSIGFHLQRRILNNNQPLVFHRALFQSWPAGIQPRPKKQAEAYNRHFAQLAGCSTSAHEGTEFIYQVFRNNTVILLPEALGVIGLFWHPQNVKAIAKLYNVTFDSKTIDYRPTISQLINDYAFACPLRNMSRALTLAHKTDVYAYLFNYILEANGTLYGSSHWAPECYERVCHKSEMPFVFNPAGVPTILFNEREKPFTQLINRYWTNFGKTGNPNEPSSVSPSWNVFSASASTTTLHLTLADTKHSGNYPDDRYCDFWDNLGYVF